MVRLWKKIAGACQHSEHTFKPPPLVSQTNEGEGIWCDSVAQYTQSLLSNCTDSTLGGKQRFWKAHTTDIYNEKLEEKQTNDTNYPNIL